MSRAKSLYDGSVDAKLLEQALDASSSGPFHGYLRYLIFLDGIVPMFLWKRDRPTHLGNWRQT